MKLVGFFDGSCFPNPHGLAGYGFVVYQDDIRIHEGRATIGRGYGMTNNVAEAAGLCALLDYLLSEQLDESFEVLIKGDSQVVLNVVTGQKKQPKGFFVEQALKAREKFAELQKVTSVDLEWIPREMNGEADTLASVVLSD
jgi:ribonuclease HI